jgi:hypothetical protein
MHNADEGGWRRAVLIDGGANGHRTGNQLCLRVPNNKAKLIGQRAKHETN